MSAFSLNLAGGSKGLLINSEDLCSGVKRAKVRMVGQNGKQLSTKVKLAMNCSSTSSRRKHRHSRRGR